MSVYALIFCQFPRGLSYQMPGTLISVSKGYGLTSYVNLSVYVHTFVSSTYILMVG